MIFSKTLELADYENIEDESQHIQNIRTALSGGVQHRFEHQHRTWEYSLAMKVLRDNGVKTVLDVGGGGSLFAPAMTWIGMEVLQIDPGDCMDWIRQQSDRLKKPLRYIQHDFLDYDTEEKFDAVTCLSVIEHVENDKEFFKKLLTNVKDGGFLILTTDFDSSGKPKTEGHLRTYNKTSLNRLVSIAKKEGFKLLGKSDYSGAEKNVNGYNFASLVLKKAE